MALAIAATNTYNSGGAVTSHAVNLPTGIASGNLLLIFMALNGSAAPTTPTGWTSVFNTVSSDTYVVYAKIASGSEGSTVTVTSGSARAVANTYRITGNRNGVTSSEIVASSPSNATTSTPDPPSLTPSWGSAENLWFAVAFSTSGAQTVSTWPTNYTLGQLDTEQGSGVGCGVATAARLYTGSSEDPGTFTFSGSLQRSAITLAVRPAATGITVAMDAGSYAMTGSAAGVKHGWMVAAGTSSYALTGQPATIKKGRSIVAGVGSYALTGVAAAIKHGWKVPAGVGSYALTGSAAGVKHGWVVAAGTSSYALTGSTAGIKHGWKVPAGTGSYSMSGTAAGVLHGWKVSAGVGSYSMDGQPANITKGGGRKTLTADPGSYALTGAAAGVKHGWVVAAGTSSYALSGQSAAIKHGWIIEAADPGSYILTGQPAAIKHGWKLPAGVSSYALTGQPAAIKHGWKLPAGAGSYALTGVDATISKTSNKVLPAGPGSYALSGQSAGVLWKRMVLAGVASYDMVGQDAGITKSTAAGEGTAPFAFGGGGDVPPVHRQKDTRWDAIREAREEARRLFDDLPATPVAERKEAAVRASEAVAKVAKNVSLTYSAFPETGPDMQPLLDQLVELQALLSGMAMQQERIRREQEREAAERWALIERELRAEAALEEELMVVFALAL